MPLYEWKCFECDEVFEYLVRKPRSVQAYTMMYCPSCGNLMGRKLFSRVHHQFTGFLRDDFWDDWEQNTPGDYHDLRGDTPKYGVGI